MKKLYIDLETRSPVDLRTCGVYVYAEHAQTEIILLAYGIDEGPVTVWQCLRGDPMPDNLRNALLDPDVLINAHNAGFERIVMGLSPARQQKFMPREIIQAMRPLRRWDCTAARSSAMGLPRALENACRVLGLSVQKDIEGAKLMMRMCKPRALDNLGNPIYVEDAASIERLGEYCIVDVLAQRGLDQVVANLSPFERQVWEATEKMNDRGVLIDQELLIKMSMFVQDAQGELNSRIYEATNRAVPKVSNTSALKNWLIDQGMPDIEKVDKEAINALLSDEDIPELIREVLLMRQEGGKSSTSKYRALISRANRDGRIRGSFIYCGAQSTKRWSSVGTQLQNLPSKATVKPKVLLEALQDIKDDRPLEDIRENYGKPLVIASELIRPTFVTRSDQWLVRGDYSQIEDRLNNWFAGQTEQLAAFRAYDAGEGPDPYRVTAGQVYGVDPTQIDKSDPRRQIGKVTRLACIASGEMVLGFEGNLPIESVSPDTKVWDGEEWVKHNGLIYKGKRHCIKYDGLTATPDHEVYVEKSTGTVPLIYAAIWGVRLHRAGLERQNSRDNCSAERHDYPEAAFQPKKGSASHRLGVLRKLQRLAQMEALGCDQQWGKFRLPELRTVRVKGIPMAAETFRSRKGQMRQFTESGICALWGAGCNIRLPNGASRNRMVSSEFRNAGKAISGYTNRPDRQQSWIRAGEPSVCNQKRTATEHKTKLYDKLQRRGGASVRLLARISVSLSGSALFGCDYLPSSQSWNVTTGHSGAVLQFAECEAKRDVWDIYECGPRNCFTVSERLVHNCGFQGGKGAVMRMAKMYRVDMTEERAEEIKSLWRERNPGIVQFWRDMEDASVEVAGGRVGHRIEVRPNTWFIKTPKAVVLKNAAGSVLYYWYASVEKIEVPWGGTKNAMVFYAEDSQTKKWVKQNSYGGLMVENCVQFTSRCITADSLIRLQDAGHPPVLTVHDENVCEVSKLLYPDPKEAAKAVRDIMLQAPPWAKGLPVNVDCAAHDRYLKD